MIKNLSMMPWLFTSCIHPLSSNAPELTSCALDPLQQTRAAATGCYGYDACHLAPFLGVAGRTLDSKSASTTWKLHVIKQKLHLIVTKQSALRCSLKRQHTAWPMRQSFSVVLVQLVISSPRASLAEIFKMTSPDHNPHVLWPTLCHATLT